MARKIHDSDIEKAENGLAFCPFCGRMARIIANWDIGFGYHHFGVKCDGCLVQSPMAFDTPEAAADFWNARKGHAVKPEKEQKENDDDDDQIALFEEDR